MSWTHEGEHEMGSHHAGHHIIDIRHKKAEFTDDDDAWRRKLVGYVHRHMAQRQHGNVTTTRWRSSLMNWGHDPLKKA